MNRSMSGRAARHMSFRQPPGMTSAEETELICSAIYHHDDKLVVDGPMDEALKDADVIHHCMNDLSKAVKDKEKARFESLCIEFGM